MSEIRNNEHLDNILNDSSSPGASDLKTTAGGGDGGNDCNELLDSMMPKMCIVWREIARKTVGELFEEATGQVPEAQEEEYLCNLNELDKDSYNFVGNGHMRFNSWGNEYMSLDHPLGRSHIHSLNELPDEWDNPYGGGHTWVDRWGDEVPACMALSDHEGFSQIPGDTPFWYNTATREGGYEH